MEFHFQNNFMGWLGMDWMVVYFMKEANKVVTLYFSSNLFIHFNC